MAQTQYGYQGYQGGAIFDQTLLLRDFVDGLSNYNATEDPIIKMYTSDTIRQISRVPQAPLDFGRAADGGNPYISRMQFRDLSFPLDNHDLDLAFTRLYLQDANPNDIAATLDAAVKGDVALVNAKFYKAALTKQSSGAIGTPYQAGFYNGETDVPPYKNSTFSSAHFHYLGLNTITLALSHIEDMKADIQEHGYGQEMNSLNLHINSAQVKAVMSLINSNGTILQAITGQRAKAIDEGIFGTGIAIEGVVIHVDDNVPAGYLLMLASDVQPLQKRLHINPQFQGLQTYQDNPNEQYPLMDLKMLRRIGFAGALLGAGTCRQLVASPTYTNPTFRLGN